MKRIKRRYIALQLECEALPTGHEVTDAIWSAVTKLYGEVGASLSGLTLINFDMEHKEVVIRVSLASLGTVRASLATITNIGSRASAVHVLAVSGTLKALHANVS